MQQSVQCESGQPDGGRRPSGFTYLNWHRGAEAVTCSATPQASKKVMSIEVCILLRMFRRKGDEVKNRVLGVTREKGSVAVWCSLPVALHHEDFCDSPVWQYNSLCHERLRSERWRKTLRCVPSSFCDFILSSCARVPTQAKLWCEKVLAARWTVTHVERCGNEISKI